MCNNQQDSRPADGPCDVGGPLARKLYYSIQPKLSLTKRAAHSVVLFHFFFRRFFSRGFCPLRDFVILSPYVAGRLTPQDALIIRTHTHTHVDVNTRVKLTCADTRKIGG